MTSEIKRVYIDENVSRWDFKGADPMVDSWFLMGSPGPLILILTAYFLILGAGPRFMKNRPAVKLDKVLMWYNALQILVSGTLFVSIIWYGIFRDGFLEGGCQFPVYATDTTLLIGTWVYFFTKVTELLDTVFFVLRKKNKQITLLHVYHHVTMVIYMWSYLKYAAAGDGAVLATLNCFIHVFMYTYYLLAGLGPKFQKFLWWKKWLTELQLVQFILMLVYLVYTRFSPRCNFSKSFTTFIGTNIAIYLVLFIDFYIKSYRKNQNKVKG